ncbi:hypothetical protein AgCh_008665 [Apium graveolens]
MLLHRRRMMYYHMEIFKEVDIIVTPTTGMTAPVIPVAALKLGETNMKVTEFQSRYIKCVKDSPRVLDDAVNGLM